LNPVGAINNSTFCGVGEMWANYFGNYVLPNAKFKYSVGWDHDEDWYNPGFLQQVGKISDMTPQKIFQCIDATNIGDLKSKLKTKTNYDELVDAAYNSYNDWL
jgi:hypothetical protein